MSHKPLNIGDTVMVYIDNITQYTKHTARTGFGFIRYIGFVPCLQSGKMTQSVGIELIEKTNNGHDGVFNNTLYFNVDHGYGIIIPITNIIKIVSTTELMLELKKTIHSLQEKNEYIQQLESIISSKNDYMPRHPPPLLTNINVHLPAYDAPSKAEQSGVLTPITPISPNITHYRQRSSSYMQFPTVPVVVRTPSVSSRHSTISSSYSTTSYNSIKHKPSKLESSITGGHIHQYGSTVPSAQSAPTTPITPFTPTSPNSPNIIHEEIAVNHVNEVIHEPIPKYTDTLHPHREYSISTSLSKRVSSLYKQPVPELRGNCDKKKSKKSKKRKKRKQNLHHND